MVVAQPLLDLRIHVAVGLPRQPDELLEAGIGVGEADVAGDDIVDQPVGDPGGDVVPHAQAPVQVLEHAHAQQEPAAPLGADRIQHGADPPDETGEDRVAPLRFAQREACGQAGEVELDAVHVEAAGDLLHDREQVVADLLLGVVERAAQLVAARVGGALRRRGVPLEDPVRLLLPQPGEPVGVVAVAVVHPEAGDHLDAVPVALLGVDLDRHHAVVHHRHQPLVVRAGVPFARLATPPVAPSLAEDLLDHGVDRLRLGVVAHDPAQIVRRSASLGHESRRVGRVAAVDDAARPPRCQRAQREVGHVILLVSACRRIRRGAAFPATRRR